MNRLLIVFFVLLVSCSQRITPTFPSYYEKDPTVLTHPFQVLYADGVTNERTGEPIENKELLPECQKLKISEEGILIVAHHTGAFTEVRGVTAVYVSDILESVLTRIQKFESSDLSYRIDTDRLFIDSFEKNMLSVAVSCVPTNSIRLCLPNELDVPANFDEFCLNWFLRDTVQSGIYDVIIYNIFDEEIYKTTVSGNSARINFNDFRYDMGLYILEVRDAKDEDLNSNKVGIKESENTYYFPTLCIDDNAAYALETAYYTEQNFSHSRFYYETILNYYQLAADLSDHPFYDQMLENFRKRSGLE